jgi:hypothetical protein
MKHIPDALSSSVNTSLVDLLQCVLLTDPDTYNADDLIFTKFSHWVSIRTALLV